MTRRQQQSSRGVEEASATGRRVHPAVRANGWAGGAVRDPDRRPEGGDATGDPGIMPVLQRKRRRGEDTRQAVGGAASRLERGPSSPRVADTGRGGKSATPWPELGVFQKTRKVLSFFNFCSRSRLFCCRCSHLIRKKGVTVFSYCSGLICIRLSRTHRIWGGSL